MILQAQPRRSGKLAANRNKRPVTSEQQTDHGGGQPTRPVPFTSPGPEQIRSRTRAGELARVGAGYEPHEPHLEYSRPAPAQRPARRDGTDRHGRAGIQMSRELARALAAALERGSRLADLEHTLLACVDDEDHIAAGWSYAWAYQGLRPRREPLAAQVTTPALAARLRRLSPPVDAAKRAISTRTRTRINRLTLHAADTPTDLTVTRGVRNAP